MNPPTFDVKQQRVLRTEDAPLLTGDAMFAADLPADGALHAVFVRATIAHGRLRSIGVDRAAGIPGLVGVFSGADLELRAMPPGPPAPQAFARPVLASGVVRFVGEPVAVVVATTAAAAMDAAELVEIELESIPPVVDPMFAAASDAPILFPEHGSNVAAEHAAGGGDPLEGADMVIRRRIINQRLAPMPMETGGALAVPDETGGVTLWAPCQVPFMVRSVIAGVLDLPEERVRVAVPAVGGAFGARIAPYPEHAVVAALALRLGQPVRYVETRSDNMVAMTHGRAQVQDVELGASRDGTLVGLRARLVQDLGAYPSEAASLPELTALMACGVYTIPRVDVRARCVVTNTTPVSAYRGAGRPEATAMLERMMDELAWEIGLDPAEVRRRNLVPPSSFPHRTATGAVYDSGEYAAALNEGLRLADYDQLRSEQRDRRKTAAQRQLGIGIASYVEVTGWGSEYGRVEVLPGGLVTIHTGVSPHGQGHETALAQICASVLSIPLEAMRVVHSDTAALPRGEGTSGSRSLQVGGSAVLMAARGLVEKGRRVAASVLEAAPEDVVLFPEGQFGVRGAAHRSLSWTEVAASAADPVLAPDPTDPGLFDVVDFDQGDPTFPSGSHVAVVEVDVETGAVRLLRHIAVDDCGRVLNPALVEGQVHGGIAQGVAQALFEAVEYDESGAPLTAGLMTYEVPTAAELPSFELGLIETPTPRNPLSAKGIGESGTIGATPAVLNAVVDALGHLGVRTLDMPLSPERVWRALREAAKPEGGAGVDRP
jgi:carbon-monoxide dehydrogenase large subunit